MAGRGRVMAERRKGERREGRGQGAGRGQGKTGGNRMRVRRGQGEGEGGDPWRLPGAHGSLILPHPYNLHP